MSIIPYCLYFCLYLDLGSPLQRNLGNEPLSRRSSYGSKSMLICNFLIVQFIILAFILTKKDRTNKIFINSNFCAIPQL